MKKFVLFLAKKLLRLEHIIYCATNCKVEGILHSAYYKRAEQRYNEYLFEKETLCPINILDNGLV